MTERLIQLLADEAACLDVPPPSAEEVLHRGRDLRRRRRVATAGAAAAVLVVAGGAFALAQGGAGRAADPADVSGMGAVFAIENQVFIDAGATAVRIDDRAVKSLYYTSAGVLVRQGNNSASDGGGPQRFSLVAADGTLTGVGVETEETVHATDPSEPYLVYGQRIDGHLVVLVHDVVTDAQVARIDVGPTRESWFPVSLDGDRVYVQDGYGGSVYVVDWRTGEVAESDVVDSVWTLADGHAITADGSRVVDVATGDTVLDLPGDRGYSTLSPDGQYVETLVEDYRSHTPPDTTISSVATGESFTVPGDREWGWTADGRPFAVTDDGTLTSCDPATGACEEASVALPSVPEEVCTTQTTHQRSGRVVESWCEGGTLDVILGGTIRES